MKKILDELKKKQDKKYAEFQAKLIPTIDKKSIIGVRTPELKKLAKELVCTFNDSLSLERATKVRPYKVLTQSRLNKGFMQSRTCKDSCLGTSGIGSKELEKFLDELPHKYFDENQLHIFILSEIKDFDTCIKMVNEFLPYIDNWATCDQLSPKCFKKNKDELMKHIGKWIKSKKPYIIRFAIEMLMSHFLDEDFDEKYLKMVADVKFGACATRPHEGSQEKISVDVYPDKYYVEMMRAWFFATALSKQY